MQSYRKSAKKAEQTLISNFTGEGGEYRITLIYIGAYMDNPEQLKKDFSKILDKREYNCNHYEMIRKFEIHGSGGWYVHLWVKESSPLTPRGRC